MDLLVKWASGFKRAALSEVTSESTRSNAVNLGLIMIVNIEMMAVDM